MTTRRLSLDLPEELVDQIEDEAKARTLGRGILIEHLLTEGLSRLRPVQNLFMDE